MKAIEKFFVFVFLFEAIFWIELLFVVDSRSKCISSKLLFLVLESANVIFGMRKGFVVTHFD